MEYCFQVQQEVSILFSELPGDEGSTEDTCGTCLGEPEIDDWHRLEACGHLTCCSCLEAMVFSAEFPLKCPKEVD